LTIRLSALLGRPVVDMTGDSRKFDLHLKWTSDDTQTGVDFANAGQAFLVYSIAGTTRAEAGVAKSAGGCLGG
jgi:uncharacterized protein (TIGR03435 family)